MRISKKQSCENVRSQIIASEYLPCGLIGDRILQVRGKYVMVDRDLAELYKVPTKALNQAVKRNSERFPERFRFALTPMEKAEVVTKCDHLKSLRFSHVPVYAFTEQGVAMLATVLKSDIAIKTSMDIMDAFVAMRSFLMSSVGVLQRLGAIEIKQLETDKRIDTVFDALDRGNLLPSGILPAESEFDSMRYVSRLIESAQSEIVLIDPYSDVVTLEVLSKKRPGVKVQLVCKDRGKPTPTEIAKFNRQYKDLVVTYSDDFHDRFLVIDNVELHGLGSSINCLGRRVTSYTTRDPKEIGKLLATVP
ncbi:MAG: ORF6N domain-containing protein [Kiritimatiellae bacterium]|nr:ORF6N domain-containing protein [Kiritimatiellia bacterium]